MIKAIDYASNTNFKGNEVKKQEKQEKTPKQIKNGKKKLAIGLAAAATVAIAGITIATKVKNGKPVDGKTVLALTDKAQEVASETTQEVAQKAGQNLADKTQEVVSEAAQEVAQKASQAVQNFKLADIKFDKGIASINGEKFTGTVSDTLANGDKVALTYENGKIMQSVREGSINATRKFEYGCYDPYNSGVGTKITTLSSEGKVIGETKLGFSKDGKLNFKTFSDGTAKWWHENGHMWCETFPDGTRKEWYENGQMWSETFPDGTEKVWYKNGQLKREDFLDGTVKHFDLNGQEIK